MDLLSVLRKLHEMKQSVMENGPDSEEMKKFMAGFGKCECNDCKPKEESKPESKAALHENETEPYICNGYIRDMEGDFISIDHVQVFYRSGCFIYATIVDMSEPSMIAQLSTEEKAKEYLNKLIEEI